MKCKKVLSVVLLIFMAIMFVTGCGDGGIASIFPVETEGRITSPIESMSQLNKSDTVAPVVTEYEPEETTAEPEPTSFTLHFAAAGNNIIHDSINKEALAASSDGSTYSYTAMYDGVADIIADADMAFLTQEAVMAGEEYGYSGYPKYNAPQNLGNNLASLGFNVINIASNHMLDMGTKGLISCAEWFKTALPDITLLGFYSDETDYDNIRVRVDEASGIRIAFLSYTYYNYEHVPDGCGVWAPFTDDKDIERQMALAKSVGDIVVVAMHWGVESDYIPNATQENYAKKLCKLGADVVIGSHPYNLQRVETLTNDEGHKTIVAYSLGNLLSATLTPRTLLGGILTFDITKDDGGVIAIDNLKLTPTFCHYDADQKNFRLYRLEDYTQELAAVHGAQSTLAFTYKDLCKYVIESVPSEILPEALQS